MKILIGGIKIMEENFVTRIAKAFVTYIIIDTVVSYIVKKTVGEYKKSEAK